MKTKLKKQKLAKKVKKNLSEAKNVITLQTQKGEMAS